MPAKIEKEGVISVFDFFQMFPDEDSAREYIEKIRWEDGVCCPHCGCEGVTKRKRVPKRKQVTKLKRKGYYYCRWCQDRFTVRTRTVFQRSHIPLNKWLYAIYMLETSRKGISSIQLAKEVGITQKSAWFMLHRLREGCDVEVAPLKGEVEIDETWIGGKKTRMHYAKKKLLPPGPYGGKVPVLGLRERETGRVIAYPIENVGIDTLTVNVLANVEEGSTVYTDDHQGYNRLDKWYDHLSVNHTDWQFADGDITTNRIESIWAVLKRGYRGVYHYMSEKHLERYVNEFVFRLNAGGDEVPIMDRMEMLVRGAFDRHITYDELIAD